MSITEEAPIDTNDPPPDSAVSAIRVEGLTKDFGTHRAVDRLSFDIPAGGVTGFVGPNGSGKSTTFRMLRSRTSQQPRRGARSAG